MTQEELKAFESERIYWAVEEVEREAGDIADLHLDDNLFYLKSEADKVIAEKDEAIEEMEERIYELQKATDSAWSKVNAMYDELRHHKYKRCMAVARRCLNESLWWYSKGYGFEKYDKFWEKWEKRWFALADKFKEANNA